MNVILLFTWQIVVEQMKFAVRSVWLYNEIN